MAHYAQDSVSVWKVLFALAGRRLTGNDDRREMLPEERSAMIEKISGSLAAGCSKEEFKGMRCPVCGSPLQLAIHPKKDLFFVRCDASSVHLSVHGELAIRLPWLEEFVSNGWYSTGEPIRISAVNKQVEK